KSAEVEALNKLIKYEHVEVYLPYIIYNEYITHLRDEFNQSVIILNREVRKLNKYLYKSRSIKDEFLKAVDQINFDEINEFNYWIDKYQIQVATNLDLDPTVVLTDYFNGKLPYRSLKCREDIPDSFIHHEIMKYSEQTKEEIIFICHDKKLIKSFENTRISLYDSLKDYVQKPETNKLLSAIKAEFLVELYDYFVENIEDVRERIENDLSTKIDYMEIQSNHIPSDNNEGNIASIEYVDPKDFKIIKDSLYHYGDDLYTFDTVFLADVSVDFYIYKPDYYCLDEEFYTEDHNDHYFSAQKSIIVEFKCNIKVNILIDEDDDSVTYENLEINDISFSG
ncbi:TPA: hypothetical protein JBG62_13660, partial [Legionella pneumophila]|nr:hypothetical protein [Legionella pneumophila subsp. pneumophila]HAU0493628.1 hypothetical protein [Legionella pneumophila]HAU0611803.1 hypothetical protein [Legionella pneumophila]